MEKFGLDQEYKKIENEEQAKFKNFKSNQEEKIEKIQDNIYLTTDQYIEKQNGLIGTFFSSHNPLSFRELNMDITDEYKDFLQNHNDKHEIIKDFPEICIIGTTQDEYFDDDIEIPVAVPFLKNNNLIFNADDKNVNEIMQMIVLKSLISLPVGELQITAIDTEHAGQDLILLSELDEKILGIGILTSPSSASNALAELVTIISDIKQKYLGSKYDSIEQYNEEAGEVVIPYRVLIIPSFSTKLDERDLKYLKTITAVGPSVGVYTILSNQKNDTYHKELIESISDNGLKVDKTIYSPYNTSKELTLDPIDLNAVNTIKELINKSSTKISKKIVEFSNIVNNQERWSKTSIEPLNAPIGKVGAQKIQNFVLGQNEHHALIAGATGSGKTVLLHTIINSLSHLYSPEELKFYLLDYKEGTEFAVYKNLPHMSVLSLQSERLFGLNILKGIQEEINRRGELFKSESGSNNLKEYRERSGKILHRLVVIIDEFQVLLAGSDHISMTAYDIFEDIVKRGRSFGVHLILSTQSLTGLNLDSIIGQMQLRIGMSMEENDSYKIFSPENGEAKYLTRGEAIYNVKKGAIEGNNKFTVAYMDNDNLDKHVHSLKEYAEEKELSLEKQNVFDTSIEANIENNEFFKLEHKANKRFVDCFIGEPNFIDTKHVSFRVKKDYGSNVLIIGSEKESMLSVVASTLYSLSLGSDKDSQFYTLDLLSIDDEYKDAILPVENLSVNSYVVDNAKKAETVVENLSYELDRRLDDDDITQTRIVVAILGLQNARSFRTDGWNESEHMQRLLKIIKDGPSCGIHIILQIDTYAQFSEMIDAKHLAEFESAQIMLRGPDSQKLFESQNAYCDKINASNIGILKGNQNKFELDEFKIYKFSDVISKIEQQKPNREKETKPALLERESLEETENV